MGVKRSRGIRIGPLRLIFEFTRRIWKKFNFLLFLCYKSIEKSSFYPVPALCGTPPLEDRHNLISWIEQKRSHNRWKPLENWQFWPEFEPLMPSKSCKNEKKMFWLRAGSNQGPLECKRKTLPLIYWGRQQIKGEELGSNDKAFIMIIY